jgi:hypothetical protein
MIWKLYKVIGLTYFQLALVACCGRDAFWQMDELMNTINQLIRIMERLRDCANLHPAYMKDTYGSREGYLKRHLSGTDLTLLNQLQLIDSMDDAPVHHKQALEIA